MPYTFKTHNTGNFSACGTGLSGYLTLERSKLVELFGEPMEGSGDGKTVCEWELEVTDEHGDTGVITIYDWKNYDDSAMADDYKDWNVGGSGNTSARVLNELISDLLEPNNDVYGNYVRTSLF